MSLVDLLASLENAINANDYAGAKKVAMDISSNGFAKDASVAEKVRAIRSSLPYNDPRLNTINVVSLILNIK